MSNTITINYDSTQYTESETAGVVTLTPIVTPPPVTTGTASVTSVPTGASISISGTAVGTAPITVTKNAGSYTFTAALSGYQTASQTVTINAGANTPVVFTMVANPTPPPTTGLHQISLVYYGSHTSTIDAKIVAAKPAILIDNTPAGLWHGNCNSATFQANGTTVFSYIWYNFGQAGSCNGTTINSGSTPYATNEALIAAIAKEGTKGVFIDCANPTADTGITTLCNYAHSLGLKVMVNPGESPTNESLFAVADFVMVSEAYTGQSPTSTEVGYLAQSVPIGYSSSWTATQAATYSNDAWANGFLYTYACQNYNSLPSWLTTYISLLNK